MNRLGIEKFLVNVQVGDELSVSATQGREKYSYYGEVTDITDSTVVVRNTLELEFFEALATPAILEIPLGNIYFYSVRKQDGTEIAV